MLQGLTDFAQNLSNGAADFVGGGNMRGWVHQRERSSMDAINREGMKFFNGMNERDQALDDLLNTGVFSEMMANKEGLAKLQTARQKLSDATARFDDLRGSGVASKAKIDAARADVALARQNYDAAGGELTKPLRDMAKGQDLSGKIELARVAAYDKTGGVARGILGKESRGEVGDWIQEQILKAVGSSKEDIGDELKGVVDEELRELMVQNEANRMFTLAQGKNKERWAQVMMAAAPALAAFGYSTGGFLGAQESLGEAVDLAAKERSLSYDISYQNVEWQQKASAQFHDFLQYGLLNIPEVRGFEQMRAHAASNMTGGGRGEWWGNVHSANPVQAQFMLQQMMEEYEAGRLDVNSQEFAAGVRTFVNLMAGPASN